jgi:hypothetical protein
MTKWNSAVRPGAMSPIMRRRRMLDFGPQRSRPSAGGVSMWRIPDLTCVPGGFTPCRIGKDLCREDVA